MKNDDSYFAPFKSCSFLQRILIVRTVFAEVLNATPQLRDNILISGKCGIRLANQPFEGDPKRYDFSRKHIISGVEGSLRQLWVDLEPVCRQHSETRPCKTIKSECIYAR